MSDFLLDWASIDADGTNSLTHDGHTVNVTVATPANGDGDEFSHDTIDGDAVLESSGVSDPTVTQMSFDHAVNDVSFELFDVDSGHGWDDKVTVIALDADGNEVPVEFSDLCRHEVDGNSVEGEGHSSAGVEGSGAPDSVTVHIAGPIVSLQIIHDNGDSADHAGVVGISEIEFDLDESGPALDGYVDGTSGDDLIDASYTGDPDGDMVDHNDAILPGEVGNDDIIRAGDGNDTILSGGGNDFVLAGNGDDTIHGGTGDDQLCGQDGNDTIYGDEGKDLLEGMNGNDVLYGGAGNDRITGDAGNDELHGGEGNDRMFGGSGDDLLVGDAGNDVMRGGDDQDTFVGGAGDTVFGGEGGNDNDTLDLSGAGRVNVIYDATDSERGTVQFLDASGAVTGTLDFHEIEHIILPEPALDGIVEGTAGDDLIDTAYTGDLQGDMVDHGDAILPGQTGDDDIIEAGAGNDTVLAGAGDDTVYGGSGDDTLSGGSGTNVLYGGTGDDTFIGGDGADSFAGGAGQDNLDYSGSGAGVNVNLTTGALSGGDAENDTIIQGIDGVVGSEYDDTLVGFDQEGTSPGDTFTNELFGGGGDDHIEGRGGNDLLDGGTGDDTIDGGDGDDTISGGDGEDVLSGGAGDDTIDGGEGADTIDGGDGDDTIVGGLGSDTILGGAGDDYLDGGTGGDYIDGGEGDDTIIGTTGVDTLLGGSGDDVIDAGNNDDVVDGGDGDDIISGGRGDDSLTGGAGADTLSGGDDRDTFFGGNAGDVVDGGEGGDDYDTLDLTGAAPAGGSLNIIYDSTNPENGTVEFRDGSGTVTGTMEFSNIENVVPCFTPGTMIATPKGERPVEDLRAGDKIITRDNGIQEIRWIGAKDLDWKALAANPHLKPVLVQKGALGNGLPERDMIVSPNHRLLVANDRTALYFEESEVLAAAKHLVNHRGIHEVDVMSTSYIHFMFDQHEVVLSDGAWSESFQPGDYTLQGIGNAQRSEILELFPELKTTEGRENYQAARKSLKKHEARLLVK